MQCKVSNFKITFLVWRSGAHGLAIDIDAGLLPHVDQDDWTLLGVGLGHLGQDILVSLLGGLATAVHLDMIRLNDDPYSNVSRSPGIREHI